MLNSRELMRAVAYICMTPAAWCSEDVVRKRAKAFKSGVTTSHWPHEYNCVTDCTSSRRLDPNFTLTMDQQALLCPQTIQSWRMDESAPQRGRISLMSEQKWHVVRDSVPLWQSPQYDTATDDKPIGSLTSGAEVQGHMFEKWVRLAQFPMACLTVSSIDECWVLSEDQHGCCLYPAESSGA